MRPASLARGLGPRRWFAVAIPTIVALVVLGTVAAPRPASAGGPRRIAWVAVEDARRLVKVDLTAGTVLRRFVLPGRPHNVVVGHGGAVVATMPSIGRLAVVRAGGLHILAVGGYPHDVKIASGVAIVTDETRARLLRIRLHDLSVRPSIRLRAQPHDVAISPGGGRAWVSLDGTSRVAVVDLRAWQVERYFAAHGRPHDLAFAPDGSTIWMTDWDGSVHVYGRFGRHLGDIERGVELHHLAFEPSGDRVWITDHGGHRVLVFNAHRRRLVASRRIAGAPHHVTVTPDGVFAAVANHGAGTVAVFRVETIRRVRAIRVGAGPHGIWAAP